MTEEQIKNKELIDKYYWLKPISSWTGEELSKYDYSFTILDEIHKGWKIAFGDLIAEDIQKVLDENDIKDFKILEAKEKFGELRLYHNGAPEEINRIIHAYATASKNICFKCGKPDVAQSKGYWIWTCCTQCYEKAPISKNRKYEDEFGEKEYEPMQEAYSYRQFSEGGYKYYCNDISEYITKIRKRYEDKNK